MRKVPFYRDSLFMWKEPGILEDIAPPTPGSSLSASESGQPNSALQLVSTRLGLTGNLTGNRTDNRGFSTETVECGEEK